MQFEDRLILGQCGINLYSCLALQTLLKITNFLEQSFQKASVFSQQDNKGYIQRDINANVDHTILVLAPTKHASNFYNGEV